MYTMQKMTLGAYTFARNPDFATEPRARKSAAVVQTYASAVYFSWGTFIVGQEIILKWIGMTEAMWDELQGLLVADTQVVWNPQLDAGTTYNVELKDLDGEYFTSSLEDADWRKDIELKLIIISEV